MRSLPAFLLALLLAAGPAPAAAEDATIRLDPATRHQTMRGWAAAVDLFWNPRLDPHVGAIFDRAVAEAGITRLQVGIFSGTENRDRSFDDFRAGRIGMADWRARRYAVVNDNDDPFLIDPAGFDFANLDWRIERVVLPLRQRLAARGEKLFLNVTYVAFTDQIRGGRYGVHLDPEEYAEFVLATWLHLREKYGLVPDTWEVILEPDLVKEWKRDPGLIGRAMVAAGRRLEAAGFRPAFVAPSVTDMANAVPYLEAALAVPGAREHLAEFSYHRYRGANAANLQAIAAAGARYGLPTAMLELFGGKATHDTLYQDLRLGQVTAWLGRALMGLYAPAPGGGLAPAEDVRYLLQIQRPVRPGAVRIGAVSTAVREFGPLAFVNPDGGFVVTVRATRAGTLAVTGLPAGRYRVSWAVASGSDALPAPVAVEAGGTLALAMPGAGMLTVEPAP